jgi:hypothetical protein
MRKERVKYLHRFVASLGAKMTKLGFRRLKKFWNEAKHPRPAALREFVISLCAADYDRKAGK